MDRGLPCPAWSLGSGVAVRTWHVAAVDAEEARCSTTATDGRLSTQSGTLRNAPRKTGAPSGEIQEDSIHEICGEK
jgi:hypothetical protein